MRDWTSCYPPEPPEEGYHQPCQGEGCAGCSHSGIDPDWAAEMAEQERLADEAMYEAHLERMRDWSE